MCELCQSIGEIRYGLPIPAPQFKARIAVEPINDCLIPCSCQAGLTLRQIKAFPAYLADQRGGIYYIKDGRAARMRSTLDYDGDLYVRIYTNDGKRIYVMVARLILLAFGILPYQHETPWFNDGNRRNLNLYNLEWRRRRLS